MHLRIPLPSKYPAVRSNTGCDILYLNQAGMILDSPSKVLWRPLLLHSKLSFFWGTEDEFAEPYTIVASRQELDTWVTFDIHTRKVEIGKVGLLRVKAVVLVMYCRCIVSELFIVIQLLVGRLSFSYFAIIISIDINGGNNKDKKNKNTICIVSTVVSLPPLRAALTLACSILNREQDSTRMQYDNTRSRFRYSVFSR